MTLCWRRLFDIRLISAIALLAPALSMVSDAQPRASGDPVPVTTGDRSYMNPAWSPDGTSLAFTGDRYTGISVLDLRTGDIRRLTEEAAAGFGYEWSPDGSSIVARPARFDGPRRYNAVKVFNVSTGESRQLSDYRSTMPALPHWDAGGARVYLYADRRLEVFQVAAQKESGEFSALVAADDGIVKVELASGAVQAVQAVSGDPVLNLVRSPDGTRAAFERMGGNLFLVGADGSTMVDLGPGHRPSWSPDGEWIVFSRTEDDGHTFTASDLFAVRADGSGLTRLTSTSDRLEMNPSWSPDGARIAYDDFKDGVIYVLPITL